MAPTIRLRDGVPERLKKLFDCSTDMALAETIGIDQSQWSRVARGVSAPGPAFQAQLLLAVEGKDLDFYTLFEVVKGETERRSA
ncbi:hypothetical protein [Microbispora sp. GKU 823]|uniref:hypothetical protein n=1 Tax=Microbispora sp. GKU 823 TaxID=1652100 RepID=UPI0009A386C4|nr:hypothetical protein [Microbispora sp. GKU 823]OPG13701.1 hypothetical protein B1L11_06860 [Microbispora sp. GKU 823]